MIATHDLSLTLKGKPILKKVNVTIAPGAITTFVGASGAGKTSLFKCLAGLYTNYSGDIVGQGKTLKTLSLAQRAQLTGIVFQQLHLFLHLDVLENCVHPQVTVLKTSVMYAQQKAHDLLEQFGLAYLADRMPNQLSGGQQQIVAIVRALCLNPHVLLFDEPSSALDPYKTGQLATLLKTLCAQGMAIGVCSHDVGFVKQIAQYVYLLEAGQVVEHLTCDLAVVPAGTRIANFLGG